MRDRGDASRRGAAAGRAVGRSAVGASRRRLRPRPSTTPALRPSASPPPSRSRRPRRPDPRGRPAAACPVAPITTQPRHAPTAQPMFCSIDTWRNAFRRAAGDPTDPACRRRASGRAWRRRAAPAGPRPGGRAPRASGRARRRTPGRPTPRSPGRGRSRSRAGRASRRRSRRRTRPRRAAGSTGRPRARVAAPNRSVTWRPSRIASSASIRTPAIPRPPAIRSRWRLRGSTSNGRPSGPSMSTRRPAGAA